MSFELITKSYLQAFQVSVTNALSSGAKSIELATRPVVHNYIEALVEECKKASSALIVHHDTSYTSKNRPDWRIEDATNFGVFCFGDHKSLAASGPFQPTPSEQKQITRYLALGRPVFVFDGVEFIFYRSDLASGIRCQLISKPLVMSASWQSQVIDISAETQFRNLLENPGFRKWTESQLVQQLANRARTASEEIATLLIAPLGSGSSSSEELLLCALHSLRETIAEHHDPSLRDEKACADFISQVLTFGLFYAHTRHSKTLDSPAKRRAAIKVFWSSSTLQVNPKLLRPFKAIVQALSTSLSSQNILSEWYEDVTGVLAHAEYMGTEPGPQDFHTLFEQFLTTFDEQARFDRGAFYTPQVLTDWIAKGANQVSIDNFGQPIMQAAEKIIDPCCGTGGFLEAVYLLNAKSSSKQAILIGFEILPAPYALAHYRLAEVFDGDPNPPQLKIILTDTLADQLLQPQGTTSNGFGEELNDAIKLSKSPLLLVIGNPPSSNHTASCAARTVIEKKLDVFRPPRLERTDRQNIQKALNNEAYRFLRWCGDKAIESGMGILALVMPGAFARAVSFQYARKWLLDNFQKIYIIEIDGDARRSDATQSVFSVLQGRLVLFALRETTNTDTLGTVFHIDISARPLSEKITFLKSDPDLNSFIELAPSEPQWKLAPSSSYPIDLWQNGWPLTSTRTDIGIYLSKCSAVKLAPTAMLFHTHKPTLLRRSADLSSVGVTPKILIGRWFAGQRKPPVEGKFTTAVKSALKVAATNQMTTTYLFRPFVHGTVLTSDLLFEALGQTPGSGVRSRPEVRAAFQSGAIGVAVAPAPSDLGATLTRFACFSWNLPDNDIASRGNAMIYCDRFPEKGSEDKTILIENVTEQIKALFSFSTSPAEAIVFYTYAILSTSTYLETFEGALYAPSDPSNPPRILIAKDLEIRKQLTNLGEKIAKCEQQGYIPPLLPLISVTWPVSVSELKLSKWSYSDETEQLTLLGEQGEIVTLQNVPQQVVALRIAGHTVIEKWLRERLFAYLRRNFTPHDGEELKMLICAVTEQESLISDAEELVKNILSIDSLIPPTAST